MCVCVSELKEAAERAQAQYRSEKQSRKEMELRVNNTEEELQDLKTDKESLERVSPLNLLGSLKVMHIMLGYKEHTMKNHWKYA